MIGGIGKKMGYDYAVKDKTFKKRLGELEYHREQIEALLDITPTAEFGKNYAEFYRKGQEAIQKLMAEKQGQVAGAFHRKELGDIDLVWGEVEGKGKEAKGYGLAKIIEKHGDEFSSFSGNTEEQKLINGINEIIQNGKLLTENGVNTLYLQKDNKVFLVGLSKGWDKKGENQWIITSYEANNLSPDILEKIGANKTFPADESLNALQTFNATDNNIIPQTPQTKPYEVNENGRKYIEIPDDELADFEKSIKQALLLEPRQQELLKKINADSKDIDSYAEFMTNERKIMKGHEFTFNQQQEGLADRFLNMANSLENPRDRNHYAENILANMKDDIEEVYKSNASEFLAREAEKPFYKQMDKIRKETDEIVEALNKERDRLHAEKEAQLKTQEEAEKAAEIERIANYDLETAYKEKAHLEKIMQSNRNDYSPYSFSPAHNSEFLDKLDLVEQRIRDLKNKLPNKAPQENKPSKVEALKEFIDNARFQVDYAKKAKGIDTALKLIQQMIKDTNNTYEAKFLYRLKNEVSSVKEAPKDIHFTDKKGKQHILTKEVQQQWLETFNLKSLDEAYTPKHSDEILQALGGKEIKLQLGSLKKLVAQSREKYIPQIKEVLDSPEAIMRDDMGEYLFIKHLKDDDYFVNVSFDNGEYLGSISNGIKETRNLNNKLEKGGSFIYQSPNFNSISQKLLQASQYSANKIDSAIIPQTPKEIIKQAKSSGKSVKETKELLQKAKELESKKDLNNELDFNGRTSQWQQEVIKQLELDKQASNKIVKIDNDSFIVYDGMSMYYYDKKVTIKL